MALDFELSDAAASALFPPTQTPLPPSLIEEKISAPSLPTTRLSLWLRIQDHDEAESLTKQLNDKERISAALERCSLRDLVLEALGEGLD